MTTANDGRLAQRGRSALKLGLVVIVASTAAYYVMGCFCGMNARYSKSWSTLDDDRWELSECLYSSVITLTTVGYTDLLGTELCELWEDDAGRHRWVSNTDAHEDAGFDEATARLAFNYSHWTRALTAFQVVLGISFFLYVIAQMTSFFVEGEYEQLKRERRLRKQLASLRDHVIVCGSDDVAAGVIERLTAERVRCALVDSDAAGINKIREVSPNVAALQADPTEPESFDRLQLRRARGLVTALDDDRLNLVTIVTARQARDDVRVITRAESLISGSRLKLAGADSAVCSSFLVGLRAASVLIRPTVVDFLDIFLQGEKRQPLAAEGIDVSKECGLHSIDQICRHDLPAVLAVKQTNGQFIYNPAADMRIEPGDRVAVIGDPGQMGRLRSILEGKVEARTTASESPIATDLPDSIQATDEPTIPRFVVCGIGDTGINILNELHVTNRPCVAIEISADRVRELIDRFPNAEIIHGDARDPAVLQQAKLGETRGLASLLPHERDNLVVAVTARQIEPGIRIVSEVGSSNDERRLALTGADVINSGRIGGRRLVAELLRPGVTTFMNQMLISAKSVRFEAVVCQEGSALSDQPIDCDSIFRLTGLRLLALRSLGESDFTANPGTDYLLKAGTRLVVAGASNQVDTLARLVGDWE